MAPVPVQSDDLRFCNCYMPPGRTLTDFRKQIDGIVNLIGHSPPDVGVVLGGDFNSKSYEWESDREDERGILLAETVYGISFTPANIGNLPTFQRGNSQFVIDVTFSRPHHTHSIRGWRVLDEFSHSDHRYIIF